MSGQCRDTRTERPRRFDSGTPGLTSLRADVHNEAEVTAALEGAYGGVNAVSLYVEHGRETFRAVHVDAAARVAQVAGASSRCHLRCGMCWPRFPNMCLELPFTRDQIALMQNDNVASPDFPGLRELGVDPTPVEAVLDEFGRSWP